MYVCMYVFVRQCEHMCTCVCVTLCVCVYLCVCFVCFSTCAVTSLRPRSFFVISSVRTIPSYFIFYFTVRLNMRLDYYWREDILLMLRTRPCWKGETCKHIMNFFSFSYLFRLLHHLCFFFLLIIPSFLSFFLLFSLSSSFFSLIRGHPDIISTATLT